MPVKFITILAAIGLLAGSSALAVAKNAMAPGQQMHAKGSVPGHPGASGYAPGHLKKAAHLRNAHSFAPGHRKLAVRSKHSAHIAAGPKLKAKASTTGSGGVKY